MIVLYMTPSIHFLLLLIRLPSLYTPVFTIDCVNALFPISFSIPLTRVVRKGRLLHPPNNV